MPVPSRFEAGSVFVYPAVARADPALRESLRQAGFRVVNPTDEAEASSVLPELRPELLLVEADGRDAAARALQVVAALHYAPDLPVVVLSRAPLSPHEAAELLGLGATEVLVPPEAPALLAAKLAALLRLKHRIDVARELSLRDELTGLYNRRFFFERLDQEVARAGRTGQGIALLLIDVDRFKKVNDTFGHPAGDDVLRRIAEVGRQHTRKSDTVARVGGDELAVLLTANSLDGARVCAEGLRRRLREAQFALPAGVPVTVSIGIAAWPGAGVHSPATDLVRLADEALLRAKAEGRDRVVVAGTLPDPSPFGEPPRT